MQIRREKELLFSANHKRVELLARANIPEAKDVITFEKLFDRLHGDSKFEFKLN